MSAVSFPSGISHAVSNVPSLNPLPPPVPAGPIPIPFPNTADHFLTSPALPVVQQLFGSGESGGDLLGVAPHTDLSLG
jgi:hypothetical protein